MTALRHLSALQESGFGAGVQARTRTAYQRGVSLSIRDAETSALYRALYIILRLDEMSTDFDNFARNIRHFPENAYFFQFFAFIAPGCFRIRQNRNQ
ncbi:MAG: hypothetical protein IJQ81_04750 [Oscillibacter sp.]|nr:hypothetical protein [Oscillibacter sp.]